MILNKIEDPRDALAKATRHELLQHARANRVSEIQHDMPATLMRKILRSRGLTRIAIPKRQLGAQVQPHAAVQSNDAPGIELDAEADLMRQYMTQSKAPVVQSLGIDAMDINALRAECRRLNIKMARGENTASLREKVKAAING